MSTWYEIENEDDVELSEDGTSIEILFHFDKTGAHYVDVPVEFIKTCMDELRRRREKEPKIKTS